MSEPAIYSLPYGNHKKIMDELRGKFFHVHGKY